MSDRSVYENEVFSQILAPFRPAPAVSDETRDCESRAIAIMGKAYPAFRSAIQDAAAMSDLRRDRLLHALAVLEDEMPDILAWEEHAAYERMGY